MKIKALGDSILFQFVDNAKHGMFTPRLSDIIMVEVASIDGQDVPRWGIVVSKGPLVGEEIEVGKFILVDGLKWTTSITLPDKSKIWKTTYPNVCAISDTEVKQY